METIINKIKPYIIYIIIGISVILIIAITYFLNSTKKVIAKVEERTEEKTETKAETYYKVDIKGAVVNPGVYSLTENSRVIDVINQAGGILETANIDLINLSKKITDEMVIIIYTDEEIKNYNEGKIKTEYVYIEVNNCPDNFNNACINKTENKNNGLININTAVSSELQNLSGIGESKAKAIIEYRNQFGLFKSIEDIKDVTGIGDSVFEKIKDYITI